MKRIASPTLFGGDIQLLTLHAEMQTQNRLHFKVIADRFSSSCLPLKCHKNWGINRNVWSWPGDRTMSDLLFLFPQIYDPNSKRFEVPHEHIPTVNKNPTSPISNTLEIKKDPFGLTVRRKENNKVLWVLPWGSFVICVGCKYRKVKLPQCHGRKRLDR